MNQLLTGTPFALEWMHGKRGEPTTHLYLKCNDSQKSVLSDFTSTSILTFILASDPAERGRLVNSSDSYFILCNTTEGSYLLPNMKWSRDFVLTPEPQAVTIHTTDDTQPSIGSYLYFELASKPEKYIYYRQLYGFRKITTKKRYYTIFKLITPSLTQLIDVNISREMQTIHAVINRQLRNSKSSTSNSKKDKKIRITEIDDEDDSKNEIIEEETDDDNKEKEKDFNLGKYPEIIQYTIASYIPHWVQIFHSANKKWNEITNCFMKTIYCYNNDNGFSEMISGKKVIRLIENTVNLRKLELRNVADLSYTHYMTICECKMLTFLNLGGCHIKDEILILISRNLNNLVVLNIAMSEITNLGLKCMCERLTQMRLLNICGCEGVNKDSIKYLIELKELRTLNVRGTKLDYKDSVRIKNALTDCEVLHGSLDRFNSIYS